MPKVNYKLDFSTFMCQDDLTAVDYIQWNYLQTQDMVGMGDARAAGVYARCAVQWAEAEFASVGACIA